VGLFYLEPILHTTAAFTYHCNTGVVLGLSIFTNQEKKVLKRTMLLVASFYSAGTKQLHFRAGFGTCLPRFYRHQPCRGANSAIQIIWSTGHKSGFGILATIFFWFFVGCHILQQHLNFDHFFIRFLFAPSKKTLNALVT
jgi:hypothetical protein